MSRPLRIVLVCSLAIMAVASSFAPDPPAVAAADESPGYDDTPFLPGGLWRVHDSARPAPAIVDPGERGAAPSDALVLFDGTDLAAWENGTGPAGWDIVGGAAQVNSTGDIQTREQFGDVQLHIEWASPSDGASESQGRGNSGVFFMGRYEIQVLDSFENRTYSDGQAAAMYGQYPPAVNASRGPGEWQTYDIVFRAPRFDGDTLLSPAAVTVIHNGVVVHHDRQFIGQTAHKRVASYEPHDDTGPIRLQDHGNPVRYRNIWVRPLDLE
ncbi:MAG: hypothetical protein ACI9EF_000094 [Pseudohongiellaceae bacterium]|jgi:hypothetical protein